MDAAGEVTGTLSARTLGGVGERSRCDLAVGGWIPATGSRNTAAGAMPVRANDSNGLRRFDSNGLRRFLGAVGTGFTDADRRRLQHA
jgi:hypothetical protein